MRITWLLEQADQIWGGVKVALEDANWLASRGHQVTVLSRSAAPQWMTLHCQFRQVPNFRPEHLPAGDVLIGTFWPTMPFVANAGPGRGVPVHFCQGYEGDFPENAQIQDRIEAVYRLPRVRHIAISANVAAQLQKRFGISAKTFPYVIDHSVHFPGAERAPGRPLRVGLVGPWQVAWKDIRTGIEACKLAAKAGLDLQLVRVTNTQPDRAELDLPFPVEWHQRVAPRDMGEIYRSLDVFLGTSFGAEEGFFLPAVEAMACGVPCVLTDVPCFRAHGDGQYAVFVPPRDPAAMAEALVVTAHMPDVRSALRTAGIAVAQRYTQHAHGTALEAALLEIALAGRNGIRALPKLTPTEPAAKTTAPSTAPAPTQRAATPSSDVIETLQHEIVALLHKGTDTLLQRGETARAARYFAAAQCIAADSPSTADRWQSCLAGDPAALLQKLEALATAGAEDPALHEQRGQLLHAAGRNAEAAQAFRAAIAAGRRSPDAYNNLGVVLFQAGDRSGARANFERALLLDPRHADATQNLADIRNQPAA
jgi:glycosyltransferase involved in cell wall biosynthesis